MSKPDKENLFMDTFRSLQNDMKRFHVSAYASSAAFFTFLSLIPMLLVFFSIMPYTPVTKADLMHFVDIMLPESMMTYAISIIEEMYHKTGAYLSLTILATLWSAGKGTLAMIRALNTLSDVEEQRNFILLRVKACVYTLIMLLSILVLLIMVVFGEQIARWITGPLPHLRYLFETLIRLRVIFVLFFLTLFFCLVYRFLPENRFPTGKTRKNGKPILKRKLRSMRSVVPGAFFTSLVWYFSSWIFGEYINRFSAFSTYGSLTTVVIIMLWLYLGFYIILIGGLLNQNLDVLEQNLKQILHMFLKKK